MKWYYYEFMFTWYIGQNKIKFQLLTSLYTLLKLRRDVFKKFKWGYQKFRQEIDRVIRFEHNAQEEYQCDSTRDQSSKV